jgi:hypothetical protein
MKYLIFLTINFLLLVRCKEHQKDCPVIYKQDLIGEDSVLFSDYYIDSCTNTHVGEEITYNRQKIPRNITLFLDENAENKPRSFYRLHFSGLGEIVFIEKYHKDSLIKLKVLNDSLFQILKKRPLE